MRKTLNQIRDGFTASVPASAIGAAMKQHEIAEAALAHAVGGVEGSYRRGTALEKPRELMQGWATYLDRQPGQDVVTMKPRKAV